jgi:hypothetical protein
LGDGWVTSRTTNETEIQRERERERERENEGKKGEDANDPARIPKKQPAYLPKATQI